MEEEIVEYLPRIIYIYKYIYFGKKILLKNVKHIFKLKWIKVKDDIELIGLGDYLIHALKKWEVREGTEREEYTKEQYHDGKGSDEGNGPATRTPKY